MLRNKPPGLEISNETKQDLHYSLDGQFYMLLKPSSTVVIGLKKFQSVYFKDDGNLMMEFIYGEIQNLKHSNILFMVLYPRNATRDKLRVLYDA